MKDLDEKYGLLMVVVFYKLILFLVTFSLALFSHRKEININ